VPPQEGFATSRLLLRRWRATDRAPFAALNADPAVMRYFTSALDRAASDALVDRIEARFEENGWGLWALELRATGEFIGFAGLDPTPADLPVDGRVEVGWRLASSAWHQGYATEAGRAAVRYGFEKLDLPELVSFTAVLNEPSQAVMRRLGMRRRGGFDHPRIPEDDPLRPHVVYRIERSR
jgi:RimJ/RimL family protein N-acetyltransferase